ncbi:MAG: sodium:calcium antiporter, partial [Acidimicrobiia bacterium]|nr:sodium:calcium antiporter [Acidimicrobiia bacterium]
MQVAVAVVVIAAGLGVAIFGSRVAVAAASRLAAGSRIPAFVVGLTLVAFGTDLPDIANSII